MSTVPITADKSAGDDAIMIDAELGTEGCAALETGVGGFARMKVRNAEGGGGGGGGEVEYELSIENPARLRLAQAVMVLQAMQGTENATLVLWDGEPSDKQRVRMRGIMRLPAGITTGQVATALRERRGALRLRIADETGTLAGCGDLRN